MVRFIKPTSIFCQWRTWRQWRTCGDAQPELRLCRDAHTKYSACGIDFSSEPVCDDEEYCRSRCAIGPACEDISLGMLGAPTAYGRCAAACAEEAAQGAP